MRGVIVLVLLVPSNFAYLAHVTIVRRGDVFGSDEEVVEVEKIGNELGEHDGADRCAEADVCGVEPAEILTRGFQDFAQQQQ